MIKEYKITQLEGNDLPLWQIQILLDTAWYNQIFTSKKLSESRTMIGSCTTWHWGDGSDVGYFWRIWAHKAVKNHIKNGGTTYVNSRFNRSKDE